MARKGATNAAISDGRITIGLDEAGRGPAYGGMTVGAAVLFGQTSGMDDSKKLTRRARNEIYKEIVSRNLAETVVINVPEWKIDAENMNFLTASAMIRAVRILLPKIALRIGKIKQIECVVDGRLLRKAFFAIAGNQKGRMKILQEDDQGFLSDIDGVSAKFLFYDKAESLSDAVAAASIAAKVFRDFVIERMLLASGPYSDVSSGVGYLGKKHSEILERFGPSVAHRKKFIGRFVATRSEPNWLQNQLWENEGRAVESETNC